MSKTGNEPAFPAEHQSGAGPGHPGLTKREYFAAMAMQAIVAGRGSIYSSQTEAAEAVACADRLLAELEKEKA